jgi:spermidine synthase
MGPARSEILEQLSSRYNEVVVRQRRKWIDFDVAGATFATWHPEKLLTGYSWDAITAACMLRPADPSSVLLLGLAGGTVVRQLRALLPTARITTVEIDEEVVELGRRHMELDRLDAEIVIGDAYEFLRSSKRTFDIVIDDVYRTGVDDVERPYRNVWEFIGQMSHRARPDGLVVANFVTGDDHQFLYEEAETVYKTQFPKCAKVVPPLGYNTILVGGESLRDTASFKTMRSRFKTDSDRKRWNKIRIQRLRGISRSTGMRPV